MLILLIAGAVVAVAGGVAAGVYGNGGDWASGSLIGGIVADALGGICLIGLLVRVGLGRRTRLALVLGLSAVVVLGAVGGAGVLAQTPLHRAQAHWYETGHHWSNALLEYQLAGEHAPGSHDLARVYDEWGEALEHQSDYVGAIAQYAAVLSNYGGATAEVQRAQTDDARAHFELGSRLVTQGHIGDAITAFEYVTSQYPHSQYASQAHAAAAQQHLTLGKQQLSTGDCSAALASYRILTANYADTPEGGQAKAALAGPVEVTGHVVNFPTDSPITIVLSSSVTGPEGMATFSSDYTTPLAADGSFTFSRVKQGVYNLFAMLPDGSGWYWFFTKPSYNPLTLTVGPLCTVNAGTYTYGGGF